MLFRKVIRGNLIPISIKPILLKAHFTGIGLDSKKSISFKLEILFSITFASEDFSRAKSHNLALNQAQYWQ